MPTTKPINFSSVLPNVTSFTIPYAQTQLGSSNYPPFDGASNVSFSFSQSGYWYMYRMSAYRGNPVSQPSGTEYSSSDSTLLSALCDGSWGGGEYRSWYYFKLDCWDDED